LFEVTGRKGGRDFFYYNYRVCCRYGNVPKIGEIVGYPDVRQLMAVLRHVLSDARERGMPLSAYHMLVYDGVEMPVNDETSPLGDKDGMLVHIPTGVNWNYLRPFTHEVPTSADALPYYSFRDLVDGITWILLLSDRKYRPLLHELGIRIDRSQLERYVDLYVYLGEQGLININHINGDRMDVLSPSTGSSPIQTSQVVRLPVSDDSTSLPTKRFDYSNKLSPLFLLSFICTLYCRQQQGYCNNMRTSTPACTRPNQTFRQRKSRSKYGSGHRG
jgi:hypothetical protein